MKTIEEFKDDVAKENGYASFIDMFNYESANDSKIDEITTQICMEYGKYVVDVCADSAKLTLIPYSGVEDWFLDKESILDVKKDIK